MATKDNARRWTADTFLPKPTNPASSLHPSNSLNGTAVGAHSNLDVIRELDDKEHSDLSFLDPRNGHQLIDSSSSGSSSGNSSGSGSNNSSSDEHDDDSDHDCSDHEHANDDDFNDSMEDVDMEDHDSTQEQAENGSRIKAPSSMRNSSASDGDGHGGKKPKRRESISASGGASAGPTRKFTKKVKKVKTKSSKSKASVDVATQLANSKPLVDRILQLENPDLNGKPLGLFMIPGMMMYVISRITRYTAPDHRPETKPDDDDSMTGIELQDPIPEFLLHVEKCRRQRDYADMEIMKRSYMTMKFLIRNDICNEFLISQSHIELVKALFDVFKPESDGNFYHFQKVFEMILRKYRVNTMDTVFATTDQATDEPIKPLIMEMLPYLDQPPVASVMMQLLFPTGSMALALMSKKMVDYYQVLRRERFIEKLIAMVTLLKEPSQGFNEFVVALLDEGVRHSDAKVLLSDLADQPVWAQRLVEGACSKSPIRQRGCIEILYSILVRSIQVPFQDMFANSIFITERSFGRVETHLENVANAYALHLAPHIPKLCELFVGTKDTGNAVALPGYKVARSFTVARLWLLDSIYHCLGNARDDPNILERIPAQFWATLVDNFIQFRFNNAYHVQFYKLFRLALWSDSKKVYDRFFIDTNLVCRLIEHYRLGEIEPTGSKGYIILILNCLRLSADVEQLPLSERKRLQQSRLTDKIKNESRSGSIESEKEGHVSKDHLRPANFWTLYLQSHNEWQSFKETLREATLIQTKDNTYDMDRNLRLQFAPLQARQPNESPMTKKHFGIPGVSATGQEGIDLGSNYSNSLGFGVPMVYEAPEKPVSSTHSREDTFTSASKGLSEVMNSMNWKLIPPQRVLNAMKKAAAAAGNNSSGGNNTGSNGGVILLPPPPSAVVDDTASAAGKTSRKDRDPGPTETSPTVGVVNEEDDASSNASTSKTKKKNKNKKKKNKKKKQQQLVGTSDDHPLPAAEPEDNGSTAAENGSEEENGQQHSDDDNNLPGLRLVSNGTSSGIHRGNAQKMSGHDLVKDKDTDEGNQYDKIEIEIESSGGHMQTHEQEGRDSQQGVHDSSRNRPCPSSSSLESVVHPEGQGQGMDDDEIAKAAKRREKRKRKKVAQQQRKKQASLGANGNNGNCSADEPTGS